MSLLSTTGCGSRLTTSPSSSSCDDGMCCWWSVSSFDSGMIDGCRLDDGDDDAVDECSTLADSFVGLAVEVNMTDTGGVKRQVTRGPRSDRLRSIGRDCRQRWSASATVVCSGDVAELTMSLFWLTTLPTSGRGDNGGGLWSSLYDGGDAVAGSNAASVAVPVCLSALYMSISTSNLASMSSTFKHQQVYYTVDAEAINISTAPIRTKILGTTALGLLTTAKLLQ